MAVVVALILLAAVVSAAFPQAREPIFEEDRVVEWATVLAFAAAFALGLRRLRQAADRDLLLLGVTVFAALAVLDELSFGERLFGWEAPHVLGTKLDAVHDLFQIGKNVIKWQTERPYLLALAFAVPACGLATLALLSLRRRGWQIRLGAEAILVGAAALCLVVAQAVDVDLRTFRSEILKPLYIEEAIELGSGILLLAFAALRR